MKYRALRLLAFIHFYYWTLGNYRLLGFEIMKTGSELPLDFFVLLVSGTIQARVARRGSREDHPCLREVIQGIPRYRIRGIRGFWRRMR